MEDHEETSLTKYADDSTILAIISKGPLDKSNMVLSTFMDWAVRNTVPCNTEKCKELILKKKGNETEYPMLYNIKQHSSFTLLGVTLQGDCKFSKHIKIKLIEAKKCLYIIRSLRKEGYTQEEIVIYSQPPQSCSV